MPTNELGMFEFKEFHKAAESLTDIREWIKKNGPFENNIRIDVGAAELIKRPSEEEIQNAVKTAMGELPNLLKLANFRKAEPFEIKDLERKVYQNLKQLAIDPFADNSVVRKSMDIGLVVKIINNNVYASTSSGIEAALFDINNNDASKNCALAIMIIDLLIEVVGLVLSVFKLHFPDPDVGKFKGIVVGVMEKKWFKKALEKLLQGIKDGDPEALIKFIFILRSQGLLSELIAKWVDQLSWGDFAAIGVTAIGSLLLVVATGGGSYWAAIAQAVINLGVIISKVVKLDKVANA